MGLFGCCGQPQAGPSQHGLVPQLNPLSSAPTPQPAAASSQQVNQPKGVPTDKHAEDERRCQADVGAKVRNGEEEAQSSN